MKKAKQRTKHQVILLTIPILVGTIFACAPAQSIETSQAGSESAIIHSGRETIAQQPTAPESTNAPATPVSAAPAASAKKNYGLSALPLRVCSIVTGTIVGTPVCMWRCSVWEEKYATKGMVGDTDDKFLQAAAGTFWLPLGAMTGVCEAPLSALKRSYANSDKPFSKDQFSLGHIDWK
jgi:hypothetical protein